MSRFREELGKQGYRRTGAKQSKSVELEGFEDWIFKVKSMGDKMKANAMKSIIKDAMKPIVFAIKANAPIRKSNQYQGTIVRKRKDGKTSTMSEVGNLYKSIGTRAFGNKEISVYAGIQHGKKNDGWYGYFLERGTKHIPKKPFIAPAAARSIPLAEERLTESINGYIIKNGKKLGLDIK